MLVSSGASVRASKTKIFNYSVKLFLAAFLDEVLIRLEVVFLEILFHFSQVLKFFLFGYTIFPIIFNALFACSDCLF
jgi:hypothetical protein